MTTTATAPGCPVDESFDPLSPGFLADPYAVLAALPLAGTPIFFAPSIGYYVITRLRRHRGGVPGPGHLLRRGRPGAAGPAGPEAQQILLAGGHSPRRAWSAWTSPSTPGSASPPPARSA